MVKLLTLDKETGKCLEFDESNITFILSLTQNEHFVELLKTCDQLIADNLELLGHYMEEDEKSISAPIFKRTREAANLLRRICK